MPINIDIKKDILYLEGKSEGIKEGLKEGIKEGISETTEKFVLNAFEYGHSIKDISIITGLSQHRVRRINKKYKQ